MALCLASTLPAGTFRPAVWSADPVTNGQTRRSFCITVYMRPSDAAASLISRSSSFPAKLRAKPCSINNNNNRTTSLLGASEGGMVLIRFREGSSLMYRFREGSLVYRASLGQARPTVGPTSATQSKSSAPCCSPTTLCQWSGRSKDWQRRSLLRGCPRPRYPNPHLRLGCRSRHPPVGRSCLSNRHQREARSPPLTPILVHPRFSVCPRCHPGAVGPPPPSSATCTARFSRCSRQPLPAYREGHHISSSTFIAVCRLHLLEGMTKKPLIRM